VVSERTERWRVEYNTQRPPSALARLPATGTASCLAETTGTWRYENAARFHIPTPPAATTDKCPTRRYTNSPLGTKDRSGHLEAEVRWDGCEAGARSEAAAEGNARLKKLMQPIRW
jgi:hypothetical protein